MPASANRPQPVNRQSASPHRETHKPFVCKGMAYERQSATEWQEPRMKYAPMPEGEEKRSQLIGYDKLIQPVSKQRGKGVSAV